MNLFESIGLKVDPFTTSPNVDLFFPATEHRQCLEGLELAIRMRRGLSVVRGGIGVGKTTVSRKLIDNFKKDDDIFDFYLILDPKFEAELALLQHIIELFGINDVGESVQKCRNIIENYLLRIGVEQGKTLVLIVDEGQNLPEEMLDVFRTLLNFETDEFKLLQLVMFGQPEMGNMIHKYPNFEDRIAFDFEIGPLSHNDTKGFIEHRLSMAGVPDQTWFSPGAIDKIYKNTHGFPRKLTLVCHQVLLAMMGEEADVITENLVDRVISGKANTAGPIQHKKKDYTQVAVNKLLNVLRNESDEPKTVNDISKDKVSVDDDIIGVSSLPDEVENNIVLEETPLNTSDKIETNNDQDNFSESDLRDIKIEKEKDDEIKLSSLSSDVDSGDDVILAKDQTDKNEHVIGAVIDDPFVEDYPLNTDPSDIKTEKKLEEEVTDSVGNNEMEDDMIGGSEAVADQNEIPIAIKKNINEEKNIEHKIFETEKKPVDAGEKNPEPEKNKDNKKIEKSDQPNSTVLDVLPYPGKYPPSISSSQIPFDKVVLGVSIDQGQFDMVLIQEQKNKKVLLASHSYMAMNRSLDPTENPAEFVEYCERALESFDRHLELLDHIPKSIVRKVSNRSIIALNINDGSSLLKHIQIPKDSQKNKNQIIDWTARKDLSFNSETAIINHSKSGSDSVTVGVGNKDALNATSIMLNSLGWEVRWWHPISQAVYNSFRWNYPDHRHHSTLILHIGQQQSFFIGCIHGDLRFVESIPIGIQNLYEALEDQGIEGVSWTERDEYLVPRPLLQAMGIESESGLYDTVFIPVFETWLQEIDRTITGMRYNFTMEEKTPLLLSGVAGNVKHLDKYIKGSLDLDTSYLNPIRNLLLTPDDSQRNDIGMNLVALSSALGSAIKINGSVNVLPNSIKLNEAFRWANRVSLPLAGIIISVMVAITGTTKADYDNLKEKIAPLKEENSILKSVDIKHGNLTLNKNTVRDQLDVLSFDTDLYQHILAVIRFLSHSTPKEIRFVEVSFRSGWENKSFRHMGGSLIQVVEMEDEDKRVMKVVGEVNANPALKERYFNNYIKTLESSELFYEVKIINKKTETGLESGHMDFELRCFL